MNQYPNWTAQLNIQYPIGTSSAEANLARVQLEKTQAQTRIRDQELQIATQVRVAAREVQTNQQRVESSRSARQLAERQLEAEQRKFEAGTSTSFLVFQAQRDLSQARNVELQNVLNFHRSIVDLETVQEAPLQGGGREARPCDNISPVPRVTVTIITLNEAAHIADAIDSAAWADEVIVVDSGSVDDTLAIARARGARV